MRTFVILLSLSLLALNANAQGKSKGKGKGKASQSSIGIVVFTEVDRNVISDWVRVQPQNGLPPGLQKGLPPGLQKQLQRNGTLPPGLQKKITPFPVELVRRLPPPPPSCDYLFLDGRALLVNRATNVIIDIFAGF
ncbi:MAG: hypothetical protein ABIR70_11270 [Bryobacteraceae bacterium]